MRGPCGVCHASEPNFGPEGQHIASSSSDVAEGQSGWPPDDEYPEVAQLGVAAGRRVSRGGPVGVAAGPTSIRRWLSPGGHQMTSIWRRPGLR